MAKRIIIFFMFILASIGISLIMAQGSTGPLAGFYSWAFIIARSTAVSIFLDLLIFLLYILSLIGLSTLMAYRQKDWGLAVPIVIHCLGVAFAAFTVGPLGVDEGAFDYLLYLLLSLAITVFYIWADWRLAVVGFGRRLSRDQ